MSTTSPLIFDGHNDLLSKLYTAGGLAAEPSVVQSVIEGRKGAIDLPKAREGGFGGGMFAVYIPSSLATDSRRSEMSKANYNVPLPDPVDFEDAVPVAMAQVALFLELERAGALRACRTCDDIRDALTAWQQGTGGLAGVLHLEGAEAIDTDLHMLDVLYAAGLRSLGPVWSRPTAFGHGVPFCFPSSPDTGPGLTNAGLRLVKRCNALGILIDLSHLNEAGFWDVARHSSAPLVATHSNVHALCPHSRNLTDKQLAAIKESDGLVGLNFAAAFLREDGRMLPDVPLETVMRQLDALIERLGEDRVGLGSDYDGAVVPEQLVSVAQLPALIAAMQQHGYGETLIRKLCHENWLRVLGLTWRA